MQPLHADDLDDNETANSDKVYPSAKSIKSG